MTEFNYHSIVIEGSGVRGSAVLGALKYIEDSYPEILDQLKNFAGSSSGAMLAGLLAIGYKPNEMIKIMTDMNFKDFLDNNFIVYNAARLPFKYALHSGKHLLKWYKGLLKDKVGDKVCDPENLTFQQVYDLYGNELVMTGVSLNTRRVKYFSRYTTPNMEVALAVRTSMSIPFLYDPVVIDGEHYIDGGILNNFPIYYFNQEYAKSHKSLDKTDLQNNPFCNGTTLGIKILDQGEQPTDQLYHGFDEINHVVDFTIAIMKSMLTEIERNDINECYWEHTIPVHSAGIDVVDFDMTPTKKEILVNQGILAAEKFFNGDTSTKEDNTSPSKDLQEIELNQ